MSSRTVRIFCVACCLSWSTACAGVYVAPVAPPSGLLFADYSAPLDIDADQSKRGNKMGTSSVESILGLVATGDASIAEAARNGGITTIRHVDYQFKNLLGIYSKFTVVVYGD